MADKGKSGRAIWRGIPIALKVLVLCLIALVALLILLPPPPEDEASGGVTTVSKQLPPLRETVNPLGRKSGPETPLPPGVPPPPVAPEIPAQPEVVSGPPPPLPARKPGSDKPPPALPEAGQAQTPPREFLPWQQGKEVARLPGAARPGNAPPPADAPSNSEIGGWVRSQAWEFLGGVDAEGNILYRFEVWLEAPEGTLAAIKSVSYDYDAPSATPRTRESEEQKGGFRVRFGSLACAKKLTVTVTMSDGGRSRAVVDGCAALNN